MNKYLRIILAVVAINLCLLLLSPLVSLLLPEKLTNHTYYRLFYHIIADRQTQYCLDDEAKALGLLQYVVDHQFAQGIPYECKPLESLIYGEAYCDFQARTLNALSAAAGIPSRYAMLLNKDGVSPHTLNEVFLNKKWCVFDPLTNFAFEDESANRLSLEEISKNIDLMRNDKKIIALEKCAKDAGSGVVKWYARMFPMPLQPKRSQPVIFQAHILDYIVDVYFKIFKYNFFNFYQDLYLKFKKKYSAKDDFRLFFIARNYHLAYRNELALKYYSCLLKEYPQSKFIEDAIFFCGMLYFEMENFPNSEELFKLILDKYSSKWTNAVYYYLGLVYRAMGNRQASIDAYCKSDLLRLPIKTIEEISRHNSENTDASVGKI